MHCFISNQSPLEQLWACAKSVLLIPQIQSVALTAERSSKASGVVSNDDFLDRRIGTCHQREEAEDEDEGIDGSANISSDAPTLPPAWAVVSIAHSEVRNAPVDPAEKAVEERAHEREQIGEERDDFGDDEGEDPCDGKDSSPA